MGKEAENTEVEKSDTALREEEIVAFWREAKIFEKTLEKEAPNGEFVFYDGPPFATGLPHAGSLLSSIIKDVVPRYKTMRGFRVRRRWGWDCHGLPIESLVEKNLGLKSKKDIENLGVANFNEAARAMVLQYAHDWEVYVERVGRWVEFKNSYKTMDNTYIESVWWALKQIHEKGNLYEGRKVLMYCPHCETPLAKAEIAMDNSYEEVTEESVIAKFKVVNPETQGFPENTYLLAWTTTPWTLPGNVALAVDEDISYVLVPRGGSHFLLAKERLAQVFEANVAPEKELKGKELVGLGYEPLFNIEKVKNSPDASKAWKVYPADFVTTESGTGIVHTAVIYGEDDYQLGLKIGLPMVPLLNSSGKFNDDAPEFIRGKYLKFHGRGFPQAQKGEDAETFIKQDLEERGLLFAREQFTHSYPHCHRCNTPLIYNAITSWFINIQNIKQRMLSLNEEVNWVPEHLKHGRFQNIVENAPDWTISRNRYWASPLPIWKNTETGELHVIGSRDELSAFTKKSGNTYTLMRHGEATHNVENVVSSDPQKHPLTEKGRKEASDALTKFGASYDFIISSPVLRARKTAEIAKELLSITSEIIYDERLREIGMGGFEGKPIQEYWAFWSTTAERFVTRPEGGENLEDVLLRSGEFLYEIEKKYSGKKILIIAHDTPLYMFSAVTAGLNREELIRAKEGGEYFMQTAEVKSLEFVPLPHTAMYALDYHRPYIDELELVNESGVPLTRTMEVVDGWVESGAMPFAEWHYPFENKEEFESRFPGDFIAEYIAQTRTWFYYMHAIATLLFDKQAFKNVISTGTILASDGAKMSKSKGNYTDPLINIARYGADALRYYLMSSVVMQAEDLKFRDDDLRDVHNRLINILMNTCSFYVLYKDEYDGKTRAGESTHVLDRWVLSRLNETIGEITLGMEKHDTVRASRPIAGFVTDFSTWYVRRSRDRFKKDDEQDKQYALATMRHVLLELSKVIAPIMPFTAERIYKEIGGEKESVHLELWPEGGEVNQELLEQMNVVREVVTSALEARSTAGVKVRQPLSTLKIKAELSSELSALILDEINVKKVEVISELENSIELDTTITPELKREGIFRDLIRHIQDLRKEVGLSPKDTIALSIDTNDEGQAIVREFETEILKTVGATGLTFVPLSKEETLLGDIPFTVEFS